MSAVISIISIRTCICK